jgi:hypothetical protein
MVLGQRLVETELVDHSGVTGTSVRAAWMISPPKV